MLFRSYSVIELPYPTDKPFPVRNIQGIPVLYSLVALLIGTASIPLGDLIWVFTDGVGWEATYETAPVGPADSDASTDSTDASTDTQTL